MTVVENVPTTLEFKDNQWAYLDAMAEKYPVYGASFDWITSDHVGLADKLRKRRGYILSKQRDSVQ